MKNIFLICLLLSCSMQFVVAQVPSQAELDKMMKEANDLMKKYGNDSTAKNAMKDQQGNITGTANSLYNSDPGAYGNIDNWKFPAKNTALLSTLPKKIFTRTELVSLLNDLYLQLSNKLTPGVAASVHSMAAKYNNDGNQMGDAAVMGWYSDHREEALLLIIKASINNPGNELLLNNCAALLNMSGIEQKAIPILKYILQSYPGSSMALNNLGLAYAGLGETDTAMVYLGRCMKIEPEHPEACNTAGQIEATKGNKEKAIEYFEKSIKSAYTKTAQLKLKKIKKDSKIASLVRPRVKLPEYFNLFKYQLPEQCTSTENAVTADAEHKAFREMIDKQAKMYGAKYAELAQMKMQDGMQIMNASGFARKLRKDEFLAHPFADLCAIMVSELLTDYLHEIKGFNEWLRKQYNVQMAALENEYQNKLKSLNDGFNKRLENCGDGKANTDCPTEEEKCTAYNALANQYLPKYAYSTEEMQKKALLIFNTYFDELVYWHYLTLHPTGDENFRMRYYEFIMKYLVTMGGICQTKIIRPCNFNSTTSASENNTIKEFDCPLEISIPFIVGKFELDCDKISFSGGEGAVFSYQKNFKTRKSTLSVGIGAKLEIGKISAGPAEASVSAGVSETLFITFDGDNKIFDFGLKFGAKVSGGAEVSGKKGISNGKSIEVKKDLGSKEVGVGYKFGIHSGWDFNEGPFKGMIGTKPEVPLNKNIKIHKPG